jgi:hypothetical protein
MPFAPQTCLACRQSSCESPTYPRRNLAEWTLPKQSSTPPSIFSGKFCKCSKFADKVCESSREVEIFCFPMAVNSDKVAFSKTEFSKFLRCGQFFRKFSSCVSFQIFPEETFGILKRFVLRCSNFSLSSLSLSCSVLESVSPSVLSSPSESPKTRSR